jgi:hypothetical protein
MAFNYYLSTQIPQQDVKHETSSDVQNSSMKDGGGLLPAVKATKNK